MRPNICRTHAEPLDPQEELGVPYELKKYQRTAEMTAPPELKKVHTMGKAPILQDGSLTLIESSAIVGEQTRDYDADLREFSRHRFYPPEYLITKYGPQFKPSEDNLVDNLQCALFLRRRATC